MSGQTQILVLKCASFKEIESNVMEYLDQEGLEGFVSGALNLDTGVARGFDGYEPDYTSVEEINDTVRKMIKTPAECKEEIKQLLNKVPEDKFEEKSIFYQVSYLATLGTQQFANDAHTKWDIRNGDEYNPYSRYDFSVTRVCADYTDKFDKTFAAFIRIQ